MANDIYESGEDYLETNLRLQKQISQVRSIDVAHALDYSKPSVSRAMKILSEKGLIYMDEKKYIHLTDLGLAKAENVARRHRLIRTALIDIFDVSPDVAEGDACRIEHIVSDETIEKIATKISAE